MENITARLQLKTDLFITTWALIILPFVLLIQFYNYKTMDILYCYCKPFLWMCRYAQTYVQCMSEVLFLTMDS